MFTALAWGILRLVGLKIGAGLQEENDWGFGQILPVVLTFLPIWSVYEKLVSKSSRSQTTTLCSSVFILIVLLKMKELKSNQRPQGTRFRQNRDLTKIGPNLSSIRATGSQSSKF